MSFWDWFVLVPVKFCFNVSWQRIFFLIWLPARDCFIRIVLVWRYSVRPGFIQFYWLTVDGHGHLALNSIPVLFVVQKREQVVEWIGYGSKGNLKNVWLLGTSLLTGGNKKKWLLSKETTRGRTKRRPGRCLIVSVVRIPGVSGRLELVASCWPTDPLWLRLAAWVALFAESLWCGRVAEAPLPSEIRRIALIDCPWLTCCMLTRLTKDCGGISHQQWSPNKLYWISIILGREVF